MPRQSRPVRAACELQIGEHREGKRERGSLRTQRVLLDRERARRLGFRFGKLIQHAMDHREVAQRRGDIGMIGAERFFPDRQRLLPGRGRLEAAKRLLRRADDHGAGQWKCLGERQRYVARARGKDITLIPLDDGRRPDAYDVIAEMFEEELRAGTLGT